MASSSPATDSQSNNGCKVSIGFRSTINWPLLHFPPINLWVMPAWNNSDAINRRYSNQEIHHA